jgi:hypothetical protein
MLTGASGRDARRVRGPSTFFSNLLDRFPKEKFRARHVDFEPPEPTYLYSRLSEKTKFGINYLGGLKWQSFQDP